MFNYTKGNESAQTILDTAQKLFYSKGINKTTLTDIAKSAHVAHSLVSYYFKDKAGIVCMVMQREYSVMLEKAQSIAQTEADTWIVWIYLFAYRYDTDKDFARFFYDYLRFDIGSENIHNSLSQFITLYHHSINVFPTSDGLDIHDYYEYLYYLCHYELLAITEYNKSNRKTNTYLLYGRTMSSWLLLINGKVDRSLVTDYVLTIEKTLLPYLV